MKSLDKFEYEYLTKIYHTDRGLMYTIDEIIYYIDYGFLNYLRFEKVDIFKALEYVTWSGFESRNSHDGIKLVGFMKQWDKDMKELLRRYE